MALPELDKESEALTLSSHFPFHLSLLTISFHPLDFSLGLHSLKQKPCLPYTLFSVYNSLDSLVCLH